MATKIFCSKCKSHCCKPEMRERIKKIIRYSGPRMIFYSPVMAVKHWLKG
ncbi:MAG: nitrous oxide-stimulated promoter family protein [Blautia sp.]|nr:nitrous oxide-stimulated promoter family protein [Blautia sp.]